MRVAHSTKIGGVWYPAGAEVPEGTNPITEKKVEVKEEVIETSKADDTPKYTKTEINRMPLDELKALALRNGVVGADEMTGGELKKLLIEMFNL